MHAAYIFYMIDQNNPSRPEPVELHPGKLHVELVALFGKDVPIELASGWNGDVVMEDEDDGQILLVSFQKGDKDAALKELGLSAPGQRKPQNLTSDELETVVEGVVDILYPGGDRDHEHGADELGAIAVLLESFNLAP